MQTKECTTCHRTLPATEFYRWTKSPDGLTYTCKTCKRAYYQAHKADYAKHRKLYYRRHAARIKAQTAKRISGTKIGRAYSRARYAAAHGQLVAPPACERCEKKEVRLYRHHDDYDKALTVTWLCGPCHWAMHHDMAAVAG